MAKILRAGALVSFFLSLFAPALVVSTKNVSGLQLFIWGWVGPSYGIFAWLANPLAVLSAYFSSRRAFDAALVTGGLAFLLAFDTFRLHEYPLNEGYSDLVNSVGPGFWMWLTSLALCTSAAIVDLYFKSKWKQ